MDAALMMLVLNAGQLHVDHDDRSAAGRCCRTLLPDALDSGFHGVRTHWIRGFMAFQLARRTGW
jgi:hypothetical protein